MSRVKHLGTVMGIDVTRSNRGEVRLEDQICILVKGEDPKQFCDELLALLTREEKSALRHARERRAAGMGLSPAQLAQLLDELAQGEHEYYEEDL